MPTPYLRSVARKKGMKLSRVEELWGEAKAQARAAGFADNYGFITAKFKEKVRGVKHSASLILSVLKQLI